MAEWNLNPDFNTWSRGGEGLSSSVFNLLLQDPESIIYYSKCLNGSTYIPVNNLENIYESLSYENSQSWWIGLSGSPYSISPTPSNAPIQITSTTSDIYYNKYLQETGFTLKTQFAPSKTIEESIQNFIQVDLATNGTQLINIGSPMSNLIIDGISAKYGQLILVKDQITYVTLPSSTNPSTYFISNYYVSQTTSTFITYYYYNNQNGIYQYQQNANGTGILIPTSYLLTYEGSSRFSVSVKLGIQNTQTQWHLSRLLSGYYPMISENQPIEFLNKHNWIIKNVVEYDNIFNNPYNDVLTHATQSYYNNYLSFTYSIPQRTVIVGDFGAIINNQDSFTSSYNISHFIYNKYKENMNSIEEISGFYWICGDSGTLLQVSKVDFTITTPNINETNNLNDISFTNDLSGVLVGDYNTIYITQDGGLTWKKLIYPEFEQLSYTRVIYYGIGKIFISGQNGVFIELTQSINQWTAYKRLISGYQTPQDNYILVEDINDMYHTTLNSWGLTWSDPSGLSVYGTVSTNKDVIVLAANNNNLIIYDINGFLPNYPYDFLYLSSSQSFVDISSVIVESGTTNVIFSNENGTWNFDLNNYLTIGTMSNYLTASIIPTLLNSQATSVNKFNQFNKTLYAVGNNGMMQTSTFSNTFSDLDPTLESRLFSKFLFLDYDIASKVNFYDTNGNYMLPNSLTFSSGDFNTTSNVYITNIPGENNWLSYYQDTDKTFKYSTSLDSSNVVLYSTNFQNNINTSKETSFSITSSVTGDYNIIKTYAPNIGVPSASRYVGSGPGTHNGPSHSVMFYKYLMIFLGPQTLNTFGNIGDVVYLQSNVVNSHFVINNITSTHILGQQLYYCYTDFNDNIINSIVEDASNGGTITITNLQYYTSSSTLMNNFSLHPISYGYTISISNDSSTITLGTTYNNKTAYYNMQSEVVLTGSSSQNGTYSMLYQDGFMDFGYTPQYSIQNYLSNINPQIFTSSKQFLSMPQYVGLPGNNGGSLTYSNIWIDTNISTNQLFFGQDLYFEWNSIFLNTFVDLNFHCFGPSPFTFSTVSMTASLVMSKYQDPITQDYVIEFERALNIPLFTNVITIDILSRNSLTQVSGDLQVLNNIQRSNTTKSLEIGHSFINLQNELNFKIYTDSYAKALLSDADILNNLSAMVYIDSSNELTLNAINITKNYNIPILNTSNYLGNLQIICSQPHGLTNSDGVVLTFFGGTGSSEFLNPQYFGFQTVQIIDQYNFYTTKNFGTLTTSPDIGNVYWIKDDPFFEFEPVDIIDLGTDLKTKIAVAIDPSNWNINGITYSLINIDLSNYRYRLIDGLDIDTVSTKFSWLLEADIRDAIIGQNTNGIVWYTGTWSCGRWYGGTWNSGTWINGLWYTGTWNSLQTTDKVITVQVGNQQNNNLSTWHNGTWYDGYWNAGTWFDGTWNSGTWSQGTWFDGTWNEGYWYNGEFMGGIWIQGQWELGTFSCDNTAAYWIDGVWNGGDFKNGMWYNGTFDQKNGNLSTFGTGAFNTRTATWQGGNWIDGSFFSYLDVNSNGNPEVSLVHKYSIWKTGKWNNGDWWGGIAYDINFLSGIWHGGILEDIEVIGIGIPGNQITLNGTFHFNINDNIWIIDNNTGGTYSLIGSNLNPSTYKIANVIFNNNETTTLILNYTLSSLGTFAPLTASMVNTGLRVVSKFTNSNWNSGIWTNGIFSGGSFAGGIWYNGVFLNGTWGS